MTARNQFSGFCMSCKATSPQLGLEIGLALLAASEVLLGRPRCPSSPQTKKQLHGTHLSVRGFHILSFLIGNQYSSSLVIVILRYCTPTISETYCTSGIPNSPTTVFEQMTTSVRQNVQPVSEKCELLFRKV